MAFGSFSGRLVDSAAGQQQTSFLVRGGRLGAREMPQMPRLSGFRVAHAAQDDVCAQKMSIAPLVRPSVRRFTVLLLVKNDHFLRPLFVVVLRAQKSVLGQIHHLSIES